MVRLPLPPPASRSQPVSFRRFRRKAVTGIDDVVHWKDRLGAGRAHGERLPLRIVFAENEPQGARTGDSGGDDMSQRATVVANNWHGEFRSYDEWARLGPQPPYGAATFVDAQGRRCITQHDFARARDDRAFPLRYRWESTPARKHT